MTPPLPRRLPTARAAAGALAVVLLLAALPPVFVPSLSYGIPIVLGTPSVSRTFPTPRDAACDFGRRYNAQSIADAREYGSVLYLVTRVEFRIVVDGGHPRVVPAVRALGYAYTAPVAGSSTSAMPDLFAARGPAVGILHSHGAYDPAQGSGNDEFSFGLFHDTYWSDLFDLPFYLVTPDGHLRVYLPDLTGPSVLTLADDLPADPRHPNTFRFSSGSSG